MTPKKNSFHNLSESYIPLTKEFYQQGCVEVAKQLLGKYFIKKSNAEYLIGRIIETEAYAGTDDKASHSYCGITNRNRIMFEEGGRLYVYLSYGVHCCANVVTGEKNIGEAVLIRAVEPVSGIKTLISNRFDKKNISEKDLLNLSNGPAKFCKAFDINLKDNGIDLLQSNILIASTLIKEQIEIMSSTRIGISKSKELLWRFFVKDNKCSPNIKNHK